MSRPLAHRPVRYQSSGVGKETHQPPLWRVFLDALGCAAIWLVAMALSWGLAILLAPDGAVW